MSEISITDRNFHESRQEQNSDRKSFIFDNMIRNLGRRITLNENLTASGQEHHPEGKFLPIIPAHGVDQGT